MKEAYRSLQLHWLAHYPEYRKLIRERVSAAAREAEQRTNQIDRMREKYYQDVNFLDQDNDACG